MNAELISEITGQILDAFAKMDAKEREKVMCRVFSVYCRHCLEHQPECGYCQCWNDE